MGPYVKMLDSVFKWSFIREHYSHTVQMDDFGTDSMS